MQYWPRKRARKLRVRSYAKLSETLPLGFAGYKAGMTHVFVTDNNPRSMTKGEDISVPVTVVECPPLKVIGIRFYKGRQPLTDHLLHKRDKELDLPVPKREPKPVPDSFDDLVLLVHAQPKMTRIGQKKVKPFELPLGGKREEKLQRAKELLGKELHVNEVFREGIQLDIHTITTGRGVQGPVRRFGITLRSHKSEKSRRAAILGAWQGQSHFMYRVPHAGQTGYHLRTEYNKVLLKIAKPEEVAVKGGYVNFGLPKATCVLLKGSIAGPKKRLVRMTRAIRPTHSFPKDAPQITMISMHSPQGR